ncbi:MULTISPECIES: LysE family translocator [unclassified Acinetobacter]|uniref:LysE family translocator n=1 Tax=unclassified Acinetobacter TaxID=196816 RepID=UPI0029343971|nr:MULTISPECIES: LysE family translocator [unclassified Acinetobacter]WOE32590.1 LysE family translocator [Acinetobacter sp. SAAs470]WOE38065.1 LysE family translocator [Acinetobacter sp. SAAs474]
MTFNLYLAFCIYAIITSVTPGPNNFMALASGVNYGIIKTIPLVLGIAFGFTIIFLLLALGINSLFIKFPILMPILKIVGCIYILYLSYLIAFAGQLNPSSEHKNKVLGFWKGAFFQWVNPKSWIVLLGSISAYIKTTTSQHDIILIGLTYGIIGFICVLLWAIVGDRLAHYLNQGHRVIIFNRIMGGLLALSLIPIINL